MKLVNYFIVFLFLSFPALTMNALGKRRSFETAETEGRKAKFGKFSKDLERGENSCGIILLRRAVQDACKGANSNYSLEQKSERYEGKIITSLAHKQFKEASRYFCKLSKITGPKREIFEEFIIAYAKNSEISRMENVLAKMKGRNLLPSIKASKAMMHAYLNLDDLDSALRLLRDMQDQGINFDMMNFITTIKKIAMANSYTIKAAIRWLKEIIQSDDSLPVFAYNGLLSLCFKFDEIEKGTEIYKLMKTRRMFSRQFEERTGLDFHTNKFFSAKTYKAEVAAKSINPKHPYGIAPSLALFTLIERNQNQEMPNKIITGRGRQVLSQTVQNFLHNNGYTWRISEDGGSLLDIRKN